MKCPAPVAASASAVTLLSLLLAGCAGEAGDTEGPSRPTGVTAQSGSSSTVHVMWSAATDNRGVTGYEVYEKDKVVKKAAGGTLMVDIVGLRPGSSYTFTVRALDAAGNRSVASAAVSATTLRAVGEDRRPPSTPQELTGRADKAKAGVTLQWRRSTDNQAVTAYDIYQAGSRIHTVSGAQSGAYLAGLRPGTIYSFTVRARDAADNSSPHSAVLDLTTAIAPGAGPNTAPTGLTATARSKGGARSIELSWQPPELGAPVKEHQLYLNGKFATTIVWGAEPPSGRATYTFTVLDAPGTRHSLKIRAKLPDGTWGDFSAQRTVVIR